MPTPISLCIEDLAGNAPRFLCCTAVSGAQPGLTLDAAGVVHWQEKGNTACEIWISADEKLILLRPAGAVPVTLRRAGRSLAVPFGKPVLVIDQDQVDIGSRSMRIHVHGETETITAPAPFAPQTGTAGMLLRTAAAAAATIGALAASGCPDVEVRDTPPNPGSPPPTQQPQPQPPQQNQQVEKQIIVRDHPPKLAPERPVDAPTDKK